MTSRFPNPRAALSPRADFQSVATRFQPQVDAGLRAIAANDARALADTLQIIAEGKLPIALEIFWRNAGNADVAICDVLLAAHKDRRDLSMLLHAAWQGAVINNNATVMKWLDDQMPMGLGFEERAALASLAVRENHLELAERLIAPVRKLGPAMRDKQSKLLVNYLHACAANNRSATALDVIKVHFSGHNDVFSAHNNTYHDIVIRAANSGHAGMVRKMLDVGHHYMNDDHMAQLMVMALDKGHEDCVHAALAYGADVQAHDSAALRHAVRHLATAVNAQVKGGITLDTRDEIARRFVMVERLMAAGANPRVAMAAAEQHIYDVAARTQVIARVAAYAQDLRGRNLERLLPAGKIDAESALAPRVYRDTGLSPSGRFEGLLHQAARHRVLDELIRRNLIDATDSQIWQHKNPAGQTLAAVAQASGHMTELLDPALWAGNVAGCAALLGVLDDKVVDGDARSRLLRAVKLTTIRAQAGSGKGKYKL